MSLVVRCSSDMSKISPTHVERGKCSRKHIKDQGNLLLPPTPPAAANLDFRSSPFLPAPPTMRFTFLTMIVTLAGVVTAVPQLPSSSVVPTRISTSAPTEPTFTVPGVPGVCNDGNDFCFPNAPNLPFLKNGGCCSGFSCADTGLGFGLCE